MNIDPLLSFTAASFHDSTCPRVNLATAVTVDTFLLLKCDLAAFLIAGAILVAMSLGVGGRAADDARPQGLDDTAAPLDPLARGDLALHRKFYHPATTDHWRGRRLLPLLKAARIVFAASIALSVGTLMWLAA